MNRYWWLTLLCFVIGGAPAGAAERDISPSVRALSALPPASLLTAQWNNDPQWSPDGKRLVVVHTTVDTARDDYATDLWVRAEGTWRALTSDAAADTTPRWSPDGHWLAFVSARVGKRQVWLLDMQAGGEPLQLTDLADGVGAYAWSPDSTRIAVVSRTPMPTEAAALPPEPVPGDKRAPAPYVTDRLRTRNDGTPGWATLKRAHLWVVAVTDAPKATARRVTDGPYEDGEPAWSGDGQWLLFSGARKADERDWPDTELYRVPVDGSAAPQALTQRPGPDAGPLVSPDGNWVAWTGFDETTPPASHRVTHLYAARLDALTADGKLQPLALTPGFDRSVGEAVGTDSGAPRSGGTRLQWCADSRCLRFAAADQGQSPLFAVGLEGRQQRLTGFASGDVREFSVSARGELAAVYATPAVPAELYLAARGQWGAAEPLRAWQATTQESFGATGRFVPYEQVRYPSFDGQQIQGWVLKPPNFDAAKKWPLVLYIHGGPHSAYGATFFHEFQVLANAGYVVLITNPRGSTSYGEAFANVIQYRYPGDDYRDLMAGVDLMLARGYIDPQRLLVGGGSGGGLLTAWTITQTDRFAAALVERAVTNWHSFVGTADMNHYFGTHWFRDLPWRETADYLARSPLQQVDSIHTPALVIHSTDDYRTALDQGLQFYAALKMQGKPAQLAVFPESSHGLSRDGRPSQRVRRLEVILDWFGRYAPGGGL